MSPKARIADPARATPFVWAPAGSAPPSPPEPVRMVPTPRPTMAPPDAAPDSGDVMARRAAVERDAFVKGYAQGEKAGLEAGIKRTDAVLRRLGETIDELAGLRRHILHHSEQ